MKKMFTLYLFIAILANSLTAQDYYNGEWYFPMPVPEVGKTAEGLDVEEQMVHYNAVTHQESIIERATDVTSISPYPSFEAPSEKEEADGVVNRNFSSFSPVGDASQSSYRRNVKVFMKYPHGNYVCSGVLVDAKHVLTAGHCLFSHQEEIWADEITVVPAYDHGSAPFGEAKSYNFYSWTGWTQDQSHNHDMGMVLLEKPIGALTGWMGYGYRNSDYFFESNTFHNEAYPSEDPFDGQQMYTRSGEYDEATTYILRFNRPSYGGASGSGAYRNDPDAGRIVYAVHSHTQTNSNTGAQRSGQTRITANKFDYLYETRLENTSDDPEILPYKITCPDNQVEAGAHLADVNIRVYNDAEERFNDRIDVRYYLVKSNGTELYLDELQTPPLMISSRSSIYIQGSVLIPENIPEGSYKLRAYIYANGAESNLNSTSIWQEPSITVTPRPYLEVDKDTVLLESLPYHFSIKVNSNIDWDMDIEHTWVQPKTGKSGSGNGTIYFTMDENMESDQRVCRVRIRGEGVSRNVVLVQRAKPSNHIDFSVMPNPAQDYMDIQFQADVSGTYRVELFNMTGVRVLTAETAFASYEELIQIPLEIGNLQSGMYYCRLTQNGRVGSKKVIVQ
jgi:V8-like Glu-specific endopeptidase